MMKKILFLVLGAIMMSTSVMAKDLIDLTPQKINNNPIGHDAPRTPIEVPLVYIEDYTLTFEVGHPDYALTIKDENDNVVYTTVVTSSQTTVVLPSTLSGNYVIELVTGNWLFTGYIML